MALLSSYHIIPWKRGTKCKECFLSTNQAITASRSTRMHTEPSLFTCGCMKPPMLVKVAKRSPEASSVARPGMMVWYGLSLV